MSPARRRRGPLAGLLAFLTRSRRARAGATILALFAIAALLAPSSVPATPPASRAHRPPARARPTGSA